MARSSDRIGRRFESCRMDLSGAYRDSKVYFCCPGCVEKFKSDSKPFAEALDAQLKAIAAGAKVIQFACPMCSKPHKTAVKRPVKKGLLNVRLAGACFCCDDCAAAIAKPARAMPLATLRSPVAICTRV